MNKAIYYPSFDGLRALAISLVFVYHFNSALLPFGWIGVDLFFVLSGFLITGILLRTAEQSNYFSGFYVRRALRIFPLYYLVLVIFIGVLPLLSTALHTKNDFVNLWNVKFWYVFYVQNIYNSKYGWVSPGYLNHLWSLAVEEHFYLFWPLVLFMTRGKTRELILISCALIVLAVGLRFLFLLGFHNPIASLTFTFARLDALLVGSVISILQYARKTSFFSERTTSLMMGFVFFMVLFAICNKIEWLLPLGNLWLALSFGCVTFYLFYYDFVGKKTRLGSIMSLPFLQYLGKWSYGFYVYHYPVILFFKTRGYRMVQPLNFPEFVNDWVIGLVLFMITLCISALSYYLFERNFLKLKRKFSYSGLE